MDRLYQNIMDSSPLSAPYIGKKLVTDKQRVAPICPHDLHGLNIVLRERVYYHITDEGRLALQEMIEDYHLVADATAAILNFHKDEDASTDKAN